jgi:hypothetical protein
MGGDRSEFSVANGAGAIPDARQLHILSNQYVVGWHPEYATFTDPDPDEPKKG